MGPVLVGVRAPRHSAMIALASPGVASRLKRHSLLDDLRKAEPGSPVAGLVDYHQAFGPNSLLTLTGGIVEERWPD